MKNILVAVDLRDSDSVLIEQAASLAEKFGAQIWIIHAAAPDPDFVGYGVGPMYIREMRAGELRKEHRKLQDYSSELEHKGLTAESLLVQGPTIEMIRTEVKKLQIDLLIMGSHKHSFLYEAFVGHTSVRIIKDVEVPVLIMPLPGE